MVTTAYCTKPSNGINCACLGINGQHAHIDGCDGTKTSVCMKRRKEDDSS